MGTIIKPSPIHGLGVFAAKDFRDGDFILILFGCNLKVTDEGAKINHRDDGNTSLVRDRINGDLRLYASRYIPRGEEVTLNYATCPYTKSL